MRFYKAVAIVSIFALTGLLVAQDENKGKKEEKTEKAFAQFVDSGPGVYHIKMDDKGRIQSFIVVGQSRISTVLGTAKGLETARDRSRLGASAEFRKWLKEKVSVHQKNEDETVLFLEGSEGNNQDALRESGKAIEKTSKKMESCSQGLVRGLQVLGSDVSDKNKTYTVVMGWNAKTAAATQKVDANLIIPEKSGKNQDGKKLEDKQSISPDLKKFLEK